MSLMKKMNAQVTFWALVTLLALNGCSTYTANAPVSEQSAIPSDEDSADFLDRASELETIDMDNALHGFCLLVDGNDVSEDFQSRVDKLSQQGIISSNWTLSAQQVLTKGQLAYMAYQACRVKEKGIILSLFGPSPRYCLRELQYRGMMAPGGESMRVTGMEFAAVITRADLYKRTGLFANAGGLPE